MIPTGLNCVVCAVQLIVLACSEIFLPGGHMLSFTLLQSSSALHSDSKHGPLCFKELTSIRENVQYNQGRGKKTDVLLLSFVSFCSSPN